MNFTADWASSRYKDWGKWLMPFVGKDIRAIELGSYEGRSAIWFVENILTHPNSMLDCVDGFFRGSKYYPNFLSNILESGVYEKINIHRGDTHTLLRAMPQDAVYDFAYIDADHRGEAVLKDAILVWPMIKEGGVIIFDDYKYPSPDDGGKSCGEGIDAFLSFYTGNYELLHTDWQLAIRKCSQKPKVIQNPKVV